MPRRELAPLPFPPTPLDLAKAIARKAEQLELTSIDQLNKLVDYLVLGSEGRLTLDDIESLSLEDIRSTLASPASPFFAAALVGGLGERKFFRLEDQAIALSREAEQFFSPAAKGAPRWMA